MKLLREPLLHFAIVGAIVFAGYSWLERTGGGPGQIPEAGAVGPVRIGEGDLRWLKQTWESQWLREPTADELSGLVEELVNEELLAREARELGLGEHDTVIRRRLAQKMKFLVEDTAHLADPTEEELRHFHAANAARFATPATISFDQVYFNPERREDAKADAAAALAALLEDPESDAEAVGDRSLLGESFAGLNELGLSSMFGKDFARQVLALPAGEWKGPIESGYGFHLLRVRRRIDSEPQPFESVKDDVLAEWRNQRQESLNRDYLAELRRKYGVELDAGAKAALRAGSEGETAAR